MKLLELLREAGLPCELKKGLARREITGICSDSRRVSGGEIFVALRGLHHDGAAFVAEAIARGAAFVLCEQPLEGENTMVVSDARAALALLWDAWYACSFGRAPLKFSGAPLCCNRIQKTAYLPP